MRPFLVRFKRLLEFLDLLNNATVNLVRKRDNLRNQWAKQNNALN